MVLLWLLLVTCILPLSNGVARAGDLSAARDLAAGIQAYRAGRQSFKASTLQRAKELLVSAVNAKPSGEAFFYLGGTLSLLGRHKSAIRAYLECLKFEPNVPS